MKTKIEIDDKQARNAFQRMRQAGDDTTPLMQAIALFVRSITERAFDTQTSPEGKKWEPLSAVTWFFRQNPAARIDPLKRKKPKYKGPILLNEGDLRGSIIAIGRKSEAIVGTGIKYAPTHQFGAKKGAFGTTRNGTPIPFGDIPARPFLGIGEKDIPALNKLITQHILEAIK